MMEMNRYEIVDTEWIEYDGEYFKVEYLSSMELSDYEIIDRVAFTVFNLTENMTGVVQFQELTDKNLIEAKHFAESMVKDNFHSNNLKK